MISIAHCVIIIHVNACMDELVVMVCIMNFSFMQQYPTIPKLVDAVVVMIVKL